MMLGRPRSRHGWGTRARGVRRYGIDSTVLVANFIEALLAIGEWDEADRVSAAALRAITANFPYMLLMLRADLEVGRGDFDAARAHLEAARVTLREDRGQGIYDVFLAELALWERRWTDADQAVARRPGNGALPPGRQLRVWFCAKGLRAQAELAALARARRDSDAVRTLARSGARISSAIARARAPEASAVTPNAAAGWRWPRPSTSAQAATLTPERGRRPQTPGTSSNARPSRRTAAGARPRRSSPPAPPAPRRACRSGGVRRRDSDRREAAAARARAARPTRPARPHAA